MDWFKTLGKTALYTIGVNYVVGRLDDKLREHPEIPQEKKNEALLKTAGATAGAAVGYELGKYAATRSHQPYNLTESISCAGMGAVAGGIVGKLSHDYISSRKK